MLTLKQLKEMEPGVFSCGEMLDTPLGLNMTNSGRMLKWVAVRGGKWDWTIYCHWATNDFEFIKRQGDKIITETTIKRLVPCDDEAFAMYRY